MAVKYGKFEIPQKILVTEDRENPNRCRFIAEPFERGAGHTLGNALRRMMLNAIEAPAIVSLQFEGVCHEYMSIEGVIEDMTNIILNLKGALLRRLPLEEEPGSREPRVLVTEVEVSQEDLDAQGGHYSVKLKDVLQEGLFEVINPEMHLFTATKPMKRRVSLRIAYGRGYVPSERHEFEDRVADEILIDSTFSPVRLVNYFVENTRVGQDTDYDRLIFDVTTDGRVTPTEALTFASQVIVQYFDVFNKLKPHMLAVQRNRGMGDSDYDEMLDKLSQGIDEIELSVRSTNCLKNASIETIAELVLIPPARMLKFKNFGKKSLNEIVEKLEDMGLHLGMELPQYQLTPENVKEKMRHYRAEKTAKMNELIERQS